MSTAVNVKTVALRTGGRHPKASWDQDDMEAAQLLLSLLRLSPVVSWPVALLPPRKW